MKWVEFTPMISIKGPKIAKFIEHHLIFHFGIPTQIVRDNGKKIKKEVSDLFKGYHIRISFLTPYNS